MADRQRLVALALLAFAGSAVGQGFEPLTPLQKEQFYGFRQVAPNVYQRIGEPIGTRVPGFASTGSGVAVGYTGPMTGKAGPMDVTAKANLPMSQVHKAGAVALKVLPWLGALGGAAGAGLALWELADALRVRPQEDGSITHDPGVDQVPENCLKVAQANTHVSTAELPCNGSPSAAAAATVESMNLKPAASCGPTFNCQAECSLVSAPSPPATSGTVHFSCVTHQWVKTTGALYSTSAPFGRTGDLGLYGVVDQCPASTDPFDPQWSLPQGLAPDADGKCRQARHHWQPLSEAEVIAKIGASSAWGPTVKEHAVEKGLEGGATLQPDSWESSGPATQTGTPTSTTTTNSEGTKTTTSTPTHSYTYGGDTITVTTTTTTLTCVGASACSDPETAEEVVTEEDKPDQSQCELSPKAAGCQELDVPAGDALPGVSIPVSVTAQSGWGASDGTCPGEITLASGVVVNPFGLVCTFADGIRFLIIGFSALMGTLIFIGRIE